jgi:uncharacterized protein (TIGR02466 family)
VIRALDMDLVDIFPKTIAVAQLQSLTPQLIQQARELLDVTCTYEIKGDGGFTTEQQLLNRSLFSDVRKEILALCKEFAAAHSHIIDDLHICNSWGNIVRKGDNIRYHKHANSYISGAFYLSEGCPFNILNDGYADIFGGFLPSRRKVENFRDMESFTINPKVGRIIIFPASLKHCVLTSDSNEPRYSIAFNAIPTGRIGDPTGFMELRTPG